MDRRARLLKRLEAIREPIVSFQGYCIAGFDLEVVSGAGVGTACCQAGSRSVKGPVRLSAADHKRLGQVKARGAAVEDEDEADEEKARLARAMFAAKCRPGRRYWYFLRGEAFEPEFFETSAAAKREWSYWAAEGTEMTAWERMEDEELETWAKGLGIKVAGGKGR